MTFNAISHHFLANLQPKRDSYGFTVRPQHLQRYREYANIYKEEEEERLEKWDWFVKQQADSNLTQPSAEENVTNVESQVTEQQPQPVEVLTGEVDPSARIESGTYVQKESDADNEVPAAIIRKKSRQEWVPVRQSLNHLEMMMSPRVQKKMKDMKSAQITINHNHLPSIDEERYSGEDFKQACEEELNGNGMDYSDHAPKEQSASNDELCAEPVFPSKELEFLVQGGVPRDVRGEVWQAFVGARTRRIEKYYQDLLHVEIVAGDNQESQSGEDRKRPSEIRVGVPENLRKQIEKDLTRTFPGHPALDENGRNSLRRLLLAYALHNPTVGYCQAMNFFAGLLLLMMPEENAFWTLVGVIDDYFDGYYSPEMIESQVDQLVFEDLVRERFPKLVNHLDYLGVQVTWISAPWFLSIFVNILPWESVLRVWDVLLFEGNRVMLFRTALALMELYGPAIVTTKDTADALSLLQSLAGSTFDSSQLVLTACMGFLTITEDRLRELRETHRPAVLAAVEERSKGVQVWKDPKGLATKLYSFKKNPEPIVKEPILEEGSGANLTDADVSCSEDLDKFLAGLNIDSELGSSPEIQEQVVWLKGELCRLLEEKRTATLRAEELETALMEMVKHDNRRELTARVEELEQEIDELRQTLSDKTEQESVMIQVLMRVEQEQKLAEDARIFAEKDAAAQRYALQVLQEKYDKAMASIAHMEKRVVMAESMLEATLQYESGQVKALASPGPGSGSILLDSPHGSARKTTGLLSFGLGWRDRNKGKQNNEGVERSSMQIQANGHQEK